VRKTTSLINAGKQTVQRICRPPAISPRRVIGRCAARTYDLRSSAPLQVAQNKNGRSRKWMIPGKMRQGAWAARWTWSQGCQGKCGVMEHSAKGRPKLLKMGNLPLTRREGGRHGGGQTGGVHHRQATARKAMALSELADGVRLERGKVDDEAEFRVALKENA